MKRLNYIILLICISCLTGCKTPSNSISIRTIDITETNSSIDTKVDFPAIEQIRRIENKLKENDYMMKAEGGVDCKITFFNYHQTVLSKKIVIDNNLFSESISKSSLKTSAEQKYFEDNKVKIRGYKNVDDNMNASWKDTYDEMEFNDYIKTYGTNPYTLTSYIINEDTILRSSCIKDNDLYTLILELDTDKAPIDYQKEIKQMSGSSSYPPFNYIHLEITFDSNFVLYKILIIEKYKLEMPILGSFNCNANILQTYEYNDIQCNDIEFFKNKMN